MQLLDPSTTFALRNGIGKHVPHHYLGKGLFVTGTDTGVGKTLVAAGLVRLARERGLRCIATKPVETGCHVREGELYPGDGGILQQASEGDLSLDMCVPFRFSLPASPARAAAMEGGCLYVGDLVEHVHALSEMADLVVVEGAGGLMVPIQNRVFIIDFIQRLGYPVILVARSRLGTINHTLLSLEAMKHRGIQTAFVVLSCDQSNPGPEEDFTRGDIEKLAGSTPVIMLKNLPPEATTDPQRIALYMQETFPEVVLDRWLGR